MGMKPSNNYQSNRPESGGADRDNEREKSGLLERDKEKFAADRAAEQRNQSESGENANAESGKGSGQSTPTEN
jgi:hypothetical protein